MKAPTKCRYCGGDVVFTSNAEIYGREYGNGKCYLCRNCRAYVGVHNGTKTPLGILATPELRKLKIQCHNLFDKKWSNSTERKKCYKELADKLNIDVSECHFGYFDKEMLLKAIKILEN